MNLLRSDLLDVVYRFYPRGVMPYARIYVPPGEPYYNDTEEYLRRVEAANRGRAAYPTWLAMIRRLERYPLQNDSLSLLAGWADPAYSGRIRIIDETSFSFHVSLLGPYYGLQLTGLPEEEPVVREVTQDIEATYPGYQQVPMELGNEVVPDVTMFAVGMGEATIGMFLFSEVWSWYKLET